MKSSACWWACRPSTRSAWRCRPTGEVIVPMKGEEMNDQPEGVKCYDWFFCTRPLPKEEIEKKLGKGYEIKG